MAFQRVFDMNLSDIFLFNASVYAVQTFTEVVIPTLTFLNSNSSKYPT